MLKSIGHLVWLLPRGWLLFGVVVNKGGFTVLLTNTLNSEGMGLELIVGRNYFLLYDPISFNLSILIHNITVFQFAV